MVYFKVLVVFICRNGLPEQGLSSCASCSKLPVDYGILPLSLKIIIYTIQSAIFSHYRTCICVLCDTVFWTVNEFCCCMPLQRTQDLARSNELLTCWGRVRVEEMVVSAVTDWALGIGCYCSLITALERNRVCNSFSALLGRCQHTIYRVSQTMSTLHSPK